MQFNPNTAPSKGSDAGELSNVQEIQRLATKKRSWNGKTIAEVHLESENPTIFATREAFQNAFDGQLDKQFDNTTPHYFGKDHPKDSITRLNYKESGCGFWKFEEKYHNRSSGVYETIEFIRHSIYSSMQASKHSVDIPMSVEWNGYYFFTMDEVQDPMLHEYTLRGGGKKSVGPSIFKGIVKPALTALLVQSGCRVREKVIKVKAVDSLGTKISKKLDVLHISWNPERVPNYPLPLPQKVISPKIDARLAESYKTGARTDFEIVCRNGSLKAHKLVLALASSYHAGLQDSVYKEARENKLQLSDYPIDVVKACLDFIYLGTNPFDVEREDKKTFPDPVLLLKLSHLWDLPELNQLAANAIGQNADPSDYQEIGELGRLFRNRYLLEVYYCLTLRTKKPIPEPIKEVMKELDILPASKTL